MYEDMSIKCGNIGLTGSPTENKCEYVSQILCQRLSLADLVLPERELAEELNQLG